MSISFPGYQVGEQLYNGSRTLVYRGWRDTDQKPVVIKILKNPYPSFNELLQFRNQYTIAKNLDIAGVVRPYSLETYRNGYALVMEDFGGISLKEYAVLLGATKQSKCEALPIAEFLPMARQIVSILEGLYRDRVIHKDIKPANILINPHTKQVKLIDFSISSLLPRETQTITSPNVLEGTLAYLSPEQTGRMNRGIDYRSDFYSLGVTFFELLTGELPFTSDDPMELVHCHITKFPPSVSSIKPDIPHILSQIVSKLMAKNAEERYQSALGLKYDLETCLARWKETGHIDDFELGKRDISERFIIPEKLYGREEEVKTLLAAFDRVAGEDAERTRSQAQPGNACLEALPPHRLEAEPLDLRSQAEPGNEGGKAEMILVAGFSGIPHRLEAEPLDLRSQAEPGNEGGKAEMILVAGFSGIGKTAIVNEVHKPIVKQRGYFIKGKFDQFNRNIPFSAFVQAFRDLMWQLLTETDIKIQDWKEKILAALGDQGKVIIEVIPELERIIGKQPPFQELSGSAAQNRFNLLFQKFISVFTTKEHPLVIFLDDLQWADSASLKLMQLLMSETDSSYLLLIGAYRDNEVSPVHPFMLTLEEIQKANATVNTIVLAPLKLTDLNNLIADTLSCDTKLAVTLTELVYQKTKGNPFFATQFLKSLYEDKLINFIPPQSPLGKGGSQGGWQCDIAKVKALSLTDDVVEFMALQLQKLPGKTQDVLKLAACVGNSFDLATLAIVYEKSQVETAADLWKALQEGLLIPTSEVYKFFHSEVSHSLSITDRESANYKFLHDRVQQAAYSLIPEERKQITHYHIGQLLLQRISKAARVDRIFEIANQLNYGIALITQQTERVELAQLNLTACRKARGATAYQAAREYAAVGLSLLGEQAWQQQYEISLALHELAAEVAYLMGDFEQMETLIEAVLHNTTSILDRIKVYEVKSLSYIAQNRQPELITTILPVLEQLGVRFPAQSEPSEFDARLTTIKDYFQDRDVEDLVNLPTLTIPEKISAIRILAKIWPASYQVRPDLSPLIVMEQVYLSLRYGNSGLSPFAYATFGLILTGVVGDIELGYQFGQLALKLLPVLNSKAIEARTIVVFHNFVSLWKQHLKETLKPFLVAYSTALETGDLEWAGYGLFNYCVNAYFLGFNLNELEQVIDKHLECIRSIKQENTSNYIETFQQVVLSLIGQSNDADEPMVNTAKLEAKIIQNLKQNDSYLSFITYLHQSSLCYLFYNYVQALEHSLSAEKYLGGVVANIGYAQFYFQDSLTHLALYERASAAEKDAKLARVNSNQEKVKKWADLAPMNYLHKFNLVEAEKYRVLGKNYEAGYWYDCAISVAKENEYLQEEALANELAAKFYLEWGKEKVAAGYMQEAYYCYARWGAKAKTYDLENRYPELLHPILAQTAQALNPFDTLAFVVVPNPSIHTSTSTNRSSSSSINTALDFAAILKASQSLSGTIQLDELLHQMTQIILQNSGGDRCALIVPNIDEKWQVRAIATPEKIELCSELLDNNPNVPIKLIQYVKNTEEVVLIDDLKTDLPVIDEYLSQEQPKSVLCLPILNQGNLGGILYLENRATSGVFTSSRILILNFLCTQAAISLENARLYQQAQDYAQQLEQSQLQLVQSEKMSALGNLVAGVAHEINNPVGFISGNINEAIASVKDISKFLQLYQETFPNPGDEIEDKAEKLDIQYLLEDLPKMLASMQVGCDRIKNISTSLRTFSRADTANKVEANIHEGLDSTLMILRHRLKANEKRPEIGIVKEYGNIPKVKCYLGQLNQVFMNILANAIDSLDESNQNRSFAEIQNCPNTITIKTEVSTHNQNVTIKIKDNGKGMSEEVKNRIFDHLFTTKPVGKGTGLGLSISRQIVTETHHGNLTCESVLGEGTELAIALPIL